MLQILKPSDTNTTIIYYTDNSLEDELLELCLNHLKQKGIDIIAVSHKPVSVENNIVIGGYKPSWLTLYKQLYLGVSAAQTKYVAMAEHDCLYSDEHFKFIPPKDNVFYYNENVWFVQWAKKNHPELKGMYSKWPKKRLALSQLICNTDLLKQSLKAKLKILSKSKSLIKEIKHIGEPGVSRLDRARELAKSGRPVYLKGYLKDILDNETHDIFHTAIPNLDIRHDGNFTGPRRGKQRTYNLPPWGNFKNVLKGDCYEDEEETLDDVEKM